jgi:hypothetical protein
VSNTSPRRRNVMTSTRGRAGRSILVAMRCV